MCKISLIFLGRTSRCKIAHPSGSRILKRSLSGGSPTLTVYLFGLEEYDYTGTGTLTSQLHYYSLAGHLIGSFNGASTTFYLTDALGSVLLSFSANAVLGEQLYGPYGNSRYLAGSISTPKGYTGQIHDAVTGLDYYNARYYDPVVGMFLSIDTVQGNQQGMDPYAYVRGNPETKADPTGERYTDGSPYDYAVVLPDTNGDGGRALIVYTPSNRAAPNLNDEWVRYTHINKKGEVDALWSWPENGRHVAQCAFNCDASGWPLLGAGAIALNPGAEGLCAAAPEACVIGGLAAAVVAAILQAIQHSSPPAAYSWHDYKTEDGTTVKARKLSKKEVSNLKWGNETFEQIKSKEWNAPNADIYVDEYGEYWILPPGGKVLVHFP